MKRASITSALALSAVASVAGKQGSFSTESTGEAGTLDYRVLTLDSSGDPISVWVLTSTSFFTDVGSLLARPDSAISALTRASLARSLARSPGGTTSRCMQLTGT